MDHGIAKQLLSLDDKTLAQEINHWGGYPPPTTVTQGDKVVEVIPAQPFKSKESVWSSPYNANLLLEELGAKELGPGPRDNYTQGEYDKYFNVPTCNGSTEEFHLSGANVYDPLCFVPVVRWALKKFVGESS